MKAHEESLRVPKDIHNVRDDIRTTPPRTVHNLRFRDVFVTHARGTR